VVDFIGPFDRQIRVIGEAAEPWRCRTGTT